MQLDPHQQLLALLAATGIGGAVGAGNPVSMIHTQSHSLQWPKGRNFLSVLLRHVVCPAGVATTCSMLMFTPKHLGHKGVAPGIKILLVGGGGTAVAGACTFGLTLGAGVSGGDGAWKSLAGCICGTTSGAGLLLATLLGGGGEADPHPVALLSCAGIVVLRSGPAPVSAAGWGNVDFGLGGLTLGGD